jgi:DNA polymerase-3 subunit delta'
MGYDAFEGAMPFRDIIGHRRLVELLARSVGRDTLPPSLIFSGPSGIGKRRVAVATAQALNCTDPHSAAPGAAHSLERDACGVCSACQRIPRGMHPDVFIVEPGDTGSIKVEQARDIVERTAYRPFEGRRRVVIVCEADALVPAAQHALLKTLEEPPPSSVFILITARPDLLLPTVRSRCPRLAFRPLAAAEVAEALGRQGWKKEEADVVAATAGGSIGRALEARAGDLVEARDVALRVLAEAAATSDARRRLDAAQQLVAKTGSGGTGDRDHLSAELRAMAALVRDIELLGTTSDRGWLGNADLRPALERLTAFQGERGVRAFEAIDEGLVALERNAGVKIVADWVVLHL